MRLSTATWDMKRATKYLFSKDLKAGRKEEQAVSKLPDIQFPLHFNQSQNLPRYNYKSKAKKAEDIARAAAHNQLSF
jgi:hypothetical protein